MYMYMYSICMFFYTGFDGLGFIIYKPTGIHRRGPLTGTKVRNNFITDSVGTLVCRNYFRTTYIIDSFDDSRSENIVGVSSYSTIILQPSGLELRFPDLLVLKLLQLMG